MTKINVLKIYNNFKKYPFGKNVFSFFFCSQAPYFFTIIPKVEDLKPGHASISLKQRWILQNMIKSVHAIAICNLVEACMGLVTEVTLANNLRWIPMGMEIAYEKKSYGKLTAHSDIDPNTFFKLEKYPGPVFVPVKVLNEAGETVSSAKIKVWISQAKADEDKKQQKSI